MRQEILADRKKPKQQPRAIGKVELNQKTKSEINKSGNPNSVRVFTCVEKLQSISFQEKCST